MSGEGRNERKREGKEGKILGGREGRKERRRKSKQMKVGDCEGRKGEGHRKEGKKCSQKVILKYIFKIRQAEGIHTMSKK